MSRQVLLHHDDVGMCHGANQAFVELRALAAVDAGSVMVPCPWFPEIAEVAAADPALDVGVHLTLNAEKQHYRWSPITRTSPAAGLTDPDGYMWRQVAALRANAAPDAVEAELRAQVERALAAGMDVTHLDAHMGAALAPEFCHAYLHIGVDYGLPVLLTPSYGDYAPGNHLAGADEAPYLAMVDEARRLGFTVFGRVLETDWSEAGPTEAAYVDMVAELPAGRFFLALHPNAPGDVEAIEPRSAHVRTTEHRLLGNERFRDALATLDIDRIGFRAMRDDLRAALATGGGGDQPPPMSTS